MKKFPLAINTLTIINNVNNTIIIMLTIYKYVVQKQIGLILEYYLVLICKSLFKNMGMG